MVQNIHKKLIKYKSIHIYTINTNIHKSWGKTNDKCHTTQYRNNDKMELIKHKTIKDRMEFLKELRDHINK